MGQGTPTSLPLGDFKPADQWQTHVNAIFYGIQGPSIHDHFQTYVSRDHRLAHALTEEFLSAARENPAPVLNVQEWGVGNGNLAGCFLSHVKELDAKGKVYPRIRYALCDYSNEILKGARQNPRLADHAGRFFPILVPADYLDCFPSQSVQQIFSNEIWDDLATRVLLKDGDLLYEEYLQPCLDPAMAGMDFDTLKTFFNDGNRAELARVPSLLSAIVWERSFQRVDLSNWPFHEVLEAHAGEMAEGIPVPVNVGAFATLERARDLLAPGGMGYTGMDYGMFSMREVNAEGRPYFNIYGGQYTSMVNFELLAEVGKAIGFAEVTREYQHDFVGRRLGDRVASIVELVQRHPGTRNMQPWDRDILMLQTLQAVNGTYRSPYKHRMTYPALPGTPKKQRKQIAQLVEHLSTRGVPDTVAYVTETEVRATLSQLNKLGYREKEIRSVFDSPRDPISFVCLHFR